MLSVVIDNKIYFIDIGSGWPSLKLIPKFMPIEYSVYGMGFKTEILNSEIIIYHKTKQVYKQMIVIPKKAKSETGILNDIKTRYKDTSIYPFDNSLRFSVIKGDSFYFIKEKTLRIFNKNEMKERILNINEINDLLKNEFGLTYMQC